MHQSAIAKRRHRRSESRTEDQPADPSRWFLLPGRILTLTLLTVAPWWLGGVTSQARVVIIAVAVLALALWWFELAITRRRRHIVPWLVVPVAAGVVLAIVQLVWLPTFVFHVIAPGQVELYDKYAKSVEGSLVGGTPTSAPSPGVSSAVPDALPTPTRITTDVDGTVEMAITLVLGLVGLLLGSHYFNSRQSIVVITATVAANAAVIAVFGVVQKLKFNGKLFWLIELTQGGIPFGPYVNRNNAAGYLLMGLACSLALTFIVFAFRPYRGTRPRPIIGNDYPILQRTWLQFLLFVSELTAGRVIALVLTICIALGVVATLSRGGVVALGVAGLITIWTFGLARRPQGLLGLTMVTTLIVAGLIYWVGLSDQVIARLDRLSDTEITESDSRLGLWRQTAPAILDFSPVGGGLGSFTYIHRAYREDPERRMFVYAENQYLQTLVDAGWLGLVLLVSAIGLAIWYAAFLGRHSNSPKTLAAALLGTFLITAMIVTSIFDFGLYMPANALLMAVLCGVVAGQAHSLAGRMGLSHPLAKQVGHWPAQLLVLLVFALGVAATLVAWQSHRLQSNLGPRLDQDYSELTLAETDRRIDQLTRVAGRAGSAASYQRLGELWIHRYRLRLFDRLSSAMVKPPGAAENVWKMEIWRATSLVRLHDIVASAASSSGRGRWQRLRDDPLVAENLVPARRYLVQSRSLSPLRPEVHLLLAEVEAFSDTPATDEIHLERATAVAPANPEVWMISGFLDVAANRIDAGARNLQKALELRPGLLATVLGTVSSRLDPNVVVSQIIPDMPGLLYNFAQTQLALPTQAEQRRTVLMRADKLLARQDNPNMRTLMLHADVKRGLGDGLGEKVVLEKARILDPLDAALRERLARLYLKLEMKELAEAEIQWLLRSNRTLPRYRKLLEELNKRP
jgi:hypothetical protein